MKTNKMIKPIFILSILMLLYEPLRRLLPFYRCRWFTADIIYNPVNAFNIVDDVVRNMRQEFVRKMSPVGGHPIHRSYGPQCNCKFIGPFITHYSDAFYRQQNRAGLPYLVIQLVI